MKRVKFRITYWRVTILLAFLACQLGILASASASSAATGTGWIRLGNLSPITSAVDVYVYSSGKSSAQIVLHDVTYGTVSSYKVVTAGGYIVKMRTAGTSASSQPVLSASVTVQADRSYTVAALAVTSTEGQLMVLADALTTPTGKSLVRVIQASLDQKRVRFHCSCAPGAPGNIVSKAPPGSVSKYTAIPPGTWVMTATGPSAQASLPVALAMDTVHTEIVIDTSTGIKIVDMLDAVAPGKPPLGGAATGFGGTAPHSLGSPLPWLAVVSAGAVLILAGGLRLRRTGLRRPTAGV